jgi:hypothetical protein
MLGQAPLAIVSEEKPVNKATILCWDTPHQLESPTCKLQALLMGGTIW